MYARNLTFLARIIPLLAALLLVSACGGLESDSGESLSSVGSTPILPGTDPVESDPPPEEEPAPEPPSTETPPPDPAPAPVVTPALGASDVVVMENDSGSVNATVTLSLSESTQDTVFVDWSTSAGTATSGSDFVADQGTLTFSPGITSRTITVQILGDRLDEPVEAFRVNLRNAVNATLNTTVATVTIEDNDPTPTISVFGTGVREGQSGTTSASFTVVLSDPSAMDVAVSYYTVDGTATRDQDFEFSQGTLTIPAGEVTGTISVAVIGDTIEEPEESFELNLDNPSNATITTSSAVGIIEDDDTVRTATLSWEAPVTNLDGTCAEGLEGFRIGAGNESGTYTKIEQVVLSSGDLTCQQTGFDGSCSVPVQSCTYTVPGLTPGTWFFAVQAYDRNMNFSPYSAEVSGDIQ
jgi:hypothetical protein